MAGATSSRYRWRRPAYSGVLKDPLPAFFPVAEALGAAAFDAAGSAESAFVAFGAFVALGAFGSALGAEAARVRVGFFSSGLTSWSPRSAHRTACRPASGG